MALTGGAQRKRMHCYFVAAIVRPLCFLAILATAGATWLNHGGDLSNRRNAVGEVLINPTTVSKLRLKWAFYAGEDITATPSISDGMVYFPSWNGFIYAVNAFTGALYWQKNLGELTGLNGTGIDVNVSVSRATPTVADDLLIISIYGPAYVIAVNRFTGDLVWSTLLDPHPYALITMSGTVYLGYLYVGVSSLEELVNATECCTFRGSLAKLNVRSGSIIWQTYTLPDNGGKLGGYAGAAIWGSSPAIDVVRNLVFVGTGNLYIAPPEVLRCQENQNKKKPATHPDQFTRPDVHFDSILAFEMKSGEIKWFQQLGGYDIFYFACLVPNNPDCPPGPNLDADFGEAPMLLSIFINGTNRDIVAAIQKSGYAWALDRNNGDIIWSTVAGPGGLEGGGVWGASTDGVRVYTNIVNTNRVNFKLVPSMSTTTAGLWTALDANTGKILWSTANPSNETLHGPVTLVNGVLFGGSMAPTGPLYALDAACGKILWSYDTGATIYGGVSVSYGCIYLGNGYSVALARFHPNWTPETSLFAFCII